MQLMNPFNANDFDPTQGTPQLPIGRHPVVIVQDEIKPVKSNNGGGLLELTVKIISGPYQGMTGAYRLNLYNTNQKAVEIAHKQFSALCHVLGVYQVTDGKVLHNIPFMIEVTPQEDPKYTEISRVFDANGNEPRKAGQPAPAQTPAPAQQPQQQAAAPAWGQPPANSTPAPAWGGQQAPQASQPAQSASGWPSAPGAPAAPGGAPWGQQPQQPQAPQQSPQFGSPAPWGAQPQQPQQQAAPGQQAPAWNGQPQQAPGGARPPWG